MGNLAWWEDMWASHRNVVCPLHTQKWLAAEEPSQEHNQAFSLFMGFYRRKERLVFTCTALPTVFIPLRLPSWLPSVDGKPFLYTSIRLLTVLLRPVSPAPVFPISTQDSPVLPLYLGRSTPAPVIIRTMGCFGSKATLGKEPGQAPLSRDSTPAQGQKPAANPARPKDAPAKPIEVKANVPQIQAKSDPPRGKVAYKPLTIPAIPVISTGKLQLFHCANQRWKPAVPLQGRPVSCAGSTWVYLSDTSLFFIEERTRHTYDISLGNGAVSPVCDLTTPRTYCGAVLVDKCVYIFGGTDSVSAERCSLTEKSTQGIASMLNARSRFVPCVWESSIYLCGGKTVVVEIYRVDEDRYYVCGFTVPDASESVAVFSDASVLVISSDFISRWSVATEELSVQGRAQHSDCWSNAAAVCQGDSVFLVTSGEIMKVDLRTTAHFLVSSPDDEPDILHS